MTTTAELMASSPAEAPLDAGLVSACIDACYACAAACHLCADACMAEPSRDELLACIRLDANCADLCEVTARVLARRDGMDPTLAQAVLQTCVAATRLCAEECESHDHHVHCQLCAQACRRCEEACRALLRALVSSSGGGRDVPAPAAG